MTDLRLAWVQSPDDPTLSGGVTSYEVARSGGPNPVAIIATVPASVAADDTFLVDDVGPGAYFYRVRAVGASGKRSVWSNEASIVVPIGVRVAISFTGGLLRAAVYKGSLQGLYIALSDLSA